MKLCAGPSYRVLTPRTIFDALLKVNGSDPALNAFFGVSQIYPSDSNCSDLGSKKGGREIAERAHRISDIRDESGRPDEPTKVWRCPDGGAADPGESSEGAQTAACEARMECG